MPAAIELARAGQRGQAFLELLFKDLEPWTSGRFLNFMGHGDTADQERTRTAYTTDDHRRLTALKAHYDSRNIFRLNYNIPPRTAGDVNCSETS